MIRGLLLAFIIVPLVEIYVMIQVGKVIGGWATVLTLLLLSLVGAYLTKTQGIRAWRSIQRDLARGVPPGDALLDGAVILVGGVLLLTPGFVTDLLGLLLLIPFFRVPIKRWFKRILLAAAARGTWVRFRRF